MAQPEKPFKALLHNPGINFRRMIESLRNMSQNPDAHEIAPLYYPPMAIVCGCSSIEGSINSVASRYTNYTWHGEKKAYESIKEKITRLYALLNQKVDFGRGLFQEVLELFAARIELVHPAAVYEVKEGSEVPQDVFERTADRFSVEKVESLVNQFYDRLLQDFGLEHVWRRVGTNIDYLDGSAISRIEQEDHIRQMELLRDEGKLTEAELADVVAKIRRGEL